MANLFLDLPVPAADGVGASIDTSALGRIRTITLNGDLAGATATVEISNDGGANYVPLVAFAQTGKKTIQVAAQFMRVRVANATGVVAADCDVACNDLGGTYLALPAPAADGVAAPVDVSALGTFNTVVVSGVFTGSVIIEISEDGADWVPAMVFTQPGWKSKAFVAQFMRVRRAATDALVPGLPNIDVGAIADASAAAGVIAGPLTIWAGGRESWAFDTPSLLVAGLVFDKTQYSDFNSIVFRAVGARGDAVNAEVTLRHSGGADIVTLTFSSTALAAQESADIQASLAAGADLLEVVVQLAAAPGGSDAVELYKAWLEVRP